MFCFSLLEEYISSYGEPYFPVFVQSSLWLATFVLQPTRVLSPTQTARHPRLFITQFPAKQCSWYNMDDILRRT
jgi:hypothetical protein